MTLVALDALVSPSDSPLAPTPPTAPPTVPPPALAPLGNEKLDVLRRPPAASAPGSALSAESAPLSATSLRTRASFVLSVCKHGLCEGVGSDTRKRKRHVCVWGGTGKSGCNQSINAKPLQNKLMW